MIGFKFGFLSTSAAHIVMMLAEKYPFAFGKTSTRFTFPRSVALLIRSNFIRIINLPAPITCLDPIWMPCPRILVMFTVFFGVVFLPLACIFTSFALTLYVIFPPLFTVFLWIFGVAFPSFLLYLDMVLNGILAIVFAFTFLTSAIWTTDRSATLNASVNNIANKKRLLLWVVSADKQPAKGVDFLFYRLFVSKAIIPHMGGLV